MVEGVARGALPRWEKVVRRLLESPFTVLSVLLPEKWLQPYEPLLAARPDKEKYL